MYRPPKRGSAPLDENGDPVELHHRDQNPDGPIDELSWQPHRGKGNHSVNHPSPESDVDHGSDWSTWKKKKWREDWDEGRFNKLPVYKASLDAMTNKMAHASNAELVAAAVAVSATVVVGTRILGPRVIPVVARLFPVARQILQGGCRILPRNPISVSPTIFPGALPSH